MNTLDTGGFSLPCAEEVLACIPSAMDETQLTSKRMPRHSFVFIANSSSQKTQRCARWQSPLQIAPCTDTPGITNAFCTNEQSNRSVFASNSHGMTLASELPPNWWRCMTATQSSLPQPPRAKEQAKPWSVVVSMDLLFLLLAGCVQTRITEPTRTAVEQLLLSTATDRSLQELKLEAFSGKKVFVDTTYLESYDKPYVVGSIRDALSNGGALLVPELKEAEVVVEPRSGALSTDSASSMIGLPSMPLPIPLSGTLFTPELYLMKSQTLYSVSKVALLAYEPQSHRHLFSSGPLVGKASHKYYSFLGFIKITRSNIPEKKGGP